MKNIVLSALVVLGFAACQSEGKKTGNPEQAHVAIDFIQNFESLTKVKDPINAFKAGAESIADEAFDLDSENAKLMMTKVHDYPKTVIVVEDHTIVLTTNQDECLESASWKACMPFSRGFIKKGNLVFQEDFANNIIGTPDNQKRTIYFFNE